jgi:hypothetical protein
MPNKDARYYIWTGMIQRCYTKHHSAYKWYGAKGITVCERWRLSSRAFIEDMGVRPAGTSIDRINPRGNYEPSNCRWATPKEQQRNRTNNKLTQEKAEMILHISMGGLRSKQSIADEFGISRTMVRKIAEGRAWQ